ncbi:MAG: tetratricopeptide repeat protein [Acidobacteria bacterium]|nr:tetratricopeptide repeat protein [Acidobacteriota bacterium]
MDNLLDAEAQIAQAIASRLRGQLTTQEQSLFSDGSTANAEAYELFLRGKQEYRKNEPQLSRNLFDRAIGIDPAFADAYAWRGRAIYSQFKVGSGDRSTLEAALSDANHALQIDPNLISARRTLISIYHSTGQTEEGLKQAKKAREINADDFDAIEGSALSYFRAGMIDKAIPFYQQTVALDPDNEEIRTSLARCYLHAGEYQKGVDVLAPMVSSGQGGWWMTMLNYRGLGNLEKAIEIGKNIPLKDTENLAGLVQYGIALKAAGKADLARSIWLEAVQRTETKVAIYENQRTRIWLGSLYAHLGEREKALAQISKALAIQPDDSWTLFQAGTICAILNDRRAAVDYIKQATDHGWLGIHYIEFGIDPDFSGELMNLREDAGLQKLLADLRKKIDELEKLY